MILRMVIVIKRLKAARLAKKPRIKWTANGLVFPAKEGLNLDQRVELDFWLDPVQHEWKGHDYNVYE